MQYPSFIKEFEFAGQQVQLLLPDENAVQQQYLSAEGENMLFPYWAKLWPSAIALCKYIAEYPDLIKDKNVLELAAGLALPSMLAGKFAKQVVSSDYAADALPWIAASAKLNFLNNVATRLIDWNDFPDDLEADIVLLSDINYEPEAFDKLYHLIMGLLQKKTTILLSTPQRLMAKPFIKRLLPYCSHQQTITIVLNEEQNDIFVLYLS